jgi:hypothetical protein
MLCCTYLKNIDDPSRNHVERDSGLRLSALGQTTERVAYRIMLKRAIDCNTSVRRLPLDFAGNR